MTLGHMLSQMGFGTKTISSYPDYHSGHSHHPQYWYDPHQGHDHHDRDLHAVSKHGHHHHSHKKNNAALSALTLLAFLFFLHILQQCLREHMQAMTEPQITIMTAGRESEEKIAKNTITKIDKRTSVTEKGIDRFDYDVELESTTTELYTNPFTRIKTEEYTPKNMNRDNRIQSKYRYRNASFPGIVSSMDQL